MASKVKITRLESEIEKHRVDANWKKAVEISKQLGQKSPDLGVLVKFIAAEAKLEEYLVENPPTEKNIAKAKTDLDEAEKLLLEVGHKETRVGLQAQLLLAKIYYCKGEYNKALKILNDTPLDKTDIESSSSRMMHVVAESYAVKGLCLEHIPPATTSKYKAIEHEMLITSCFEKAGDLAIIHLQDREKGCHGGTTSGSQCQLNANTCIHIGIILEQAIQESPIMYIKKGELEKGVWRFRELLRAIETRFTQGVRLTLARQLAEVLLRGVCDKTYIPLGVTSPRQKKLKPKQYSGDRLFCPNNRDEEALLLLLIAEAIATRETVLNRSDELCETRQHAFNNTTAVFDLLALALVKRAQFTMLSESFERAMRFSFQEFHIWHQFANSLICAGKYTRALLVLKECIRLQPQNVTVYLQAARLCYEYLHQYSDGIDWSEQAVAVVVEDPMMSRAYTSQGIGYSMRAHEVKLQADRQSFNRKAMSSFQKAYELDPYDYLACFHLALQLANLRQISESMMYVKLALKYRNDHIHSLHLLVLLLTAQKQMDDAMVLIHAALEEYPQNLSLLLTQSKLEEVMLGPDESLVTCKVMMKLWKGIHDMDNDDVSEKKDFANDRLAFDRRSLAQMTFNEFSERGSGSIHAESIAASRMECALSEVASSINSNFMPRPGSHQSWLMQAQIWSHVADLYLKLDNVSEAEACIQEMSSLLPLSHQLYFMKGRVLEHKQKYKDAKKCYENAVAINPGHTRSLRRLGVILNRMNENKMAEKFLRDAVNNDPMSHKSWFSLGLVLDALGKNKEASDCLNMSTELESSSPIVAFTIIPRLMQ